MQQLSGLVQNSTSEPASAQVALLRHLSDGVGLGLDSRDAADAWQAAQHEVPTDATDWARIERAARDIGLRLSRGRRSLREAAAMAQDGWPVLIGSQGRYVCALANKGSRCRVAPDTDAAARWLHRNELPGMLGLPDLEAPVDVAVAERLNADQGLGGGRGDDGNGGGDDHHGHHSPAPGAPAHGPPPLRRLISILRAESRELWAVFILAVGVGLLMLAVPITIEALVTTVQGGTRTLLQPVIVLTAVLFVCLALAAAMRGLKTYVVEYIQQRLFVRVVADLAWRLPRVRTEAFDRQHGPELVNRFFDVLTVQKAGATLLLDGLIVVLQAGIGLIVLGFYHPFLLGYGLALLVALIFIVFVLGRGAVTTSIQESLAKYAVAGWLEEMVRQPLAFKLAAAHGFAIERADSLTRDYLLARREHFRILFRQFCFALALQVVASTALLGLGGWLVIANELTVGQLVASELIVTVVVGSLVKLGKTLESYYDLMAAVDKLGHLVDLPIERQTGEAHHERGPASLRLHGLGFHYHGGSHRDVLHGLNWNIAAGERVAIVGPSGAGKSTLVELLYGLREPAHGHIELDGVDVRDLSLESLRDQVATAAVPEVFEGTILDNVRLGRSTVSLGDVRESLRRAGLLEEVLDLPKGMHTRLTTGGAPLSAGQVQRLMLARAMAGRPRLLVLDETLDVLDRSLRAQVIRGLCERDAPWTLLLTTHDREVAQACDRTLELSTAQHDGATEEHHP